MNRILQILVVSSFLLPVLANPAFPQESGEETPAAVEEQKVFTFGGKFRNLFMFQRVDNFRGTDPYAMRTKNLFADLKRIRLSPEVHYRDLLSIRVDFDNELIMSNYNRSFEFDGTWRPRHYNDFFDLSWEPYYSRDILYRTKIHRAYIKISKDFFSLSFGRQQIRFGSGRLWNPLDILNPVNPMLLEGPEEQQGTDALLLTFNCNENTEISIIYDQKLRNNSFSDITAAGSNYLLRGKTTVSTTDIGVMGGWVARRGVVGADVSSTVLDGTLRESLLFSYPADQDVRWFFQAGMGYEYTFSEGVYLLVEYFYNGNALNFNSKLEAAAAKSLVAGIHQDNYYLLANQLFTNNEHYLGIVVGYDFIPLLRGELFTMVDIQGYALFLAPVLKYNMLENLDLGFGAMMGIELTHSTHPSEFKSFEEPFLYYMTLDLYF